MEAHSCSVRQNILLCQCPSCTTHLHTVTWEPSDWLSGWDNAAIRGKDPKLSMCILQNSHYNRYKFYMAASLHVVGSQSPNFLVNIIEGWFTFKSRKTIFFKPQKNKLLTRAFQACWSQRMKMLFNNTRTFLKLTTLPSVSQENIQYLFKSVLVLNLIIFTEY